MNINVKEIRAASTTSSKKLGFEIPASLPFLDTTLIPKTEIEICNRALVLSAVVAASYGFKKELALLWLKQEALEQYLSPKEKTFLLTDGTADPQYFQKQVEALNALAWTLGKLPELDCSKECPNFLVSLYPDFKKQESIKRFKENMHLRSRVEIFFLCDLLYCLDWALKQSSLDGKKSGKLPHYIIRERRRALEWTVSEENWDDISLDT